MLFAHISATEIRRQVVDGRVKVADVAEFFIDRVDRYNSELNAFVYFDANDVRKQASLLDERIERGEELGVLGGVPVAIKDTTPVVGMPCTSGMVALASNVPTENAPIVDRLIAADAIIFGKTNCPELAYCGKTDNHLFGATLNPWNTSMNPGGSSGGSAVAVASGMVPLSEGSDGGGSIRVPAAYNGIVGVKPSVGFIPQTLLTQRFSTNIFHGPLASSIDDALLFLEATVGPDSRDPLSGPTFEEAFPSEDVFLGRLRIAFSPDLGFARLSPEVEEVFYEFINKLTGAGIDVVESSPVWERVSDAMWDGVWVPGLAAARDSFDWDLLLAEGQVDRELYELVMEGDRLTVTDFARADGQRGAIYDALHSFMQEFDILITPVTAVPPYPRHQFNPSFLDGLPLKNRLLDFSLTHAFSLTNSPVVSLPAGLTRAGLPVGVQVVGRWHEDWKVLAASRLLASISPIGAPRGFES